MTAPYQTPEAAGLEVVAWRYINCGGGWTIHDRPIPGIPTAEPLVTAASAQAAIDAEKAKVADLEAEKDRLQAQLRTAVDAAQFEWSGDRKRLEARADRLAQQVLDLGGVPVP